MSNPLEKYILENREKFDSEVPDPANWERIRDRMNPGREKPAPVRSLPFKRWLAAAAVLLTAGLAISVYYSMQKAKTEQATTKTKDVPGGNQGLSPVADSPAIAGTMEKTGEKSLQNPTIPATKETTSPGTGETRENAVSENDKEMYYYAKLIELKHAELKTLEKDEPLLYRQFAADVQKLDSVYHSLKTQLPNNSNREQVIEAMITNLQLQIGLLNKQLDIIKKIKHSKKSAYEKAYQSV